MSRGKKLFQTPPPIWPSRNFVLIYSKANESAFERCITVSIIILILQHHRWMSIISLEKKNKHQNHLQNSRCFITPFQYCRTSFMPIEDKNKEQPIIYCKYRAIGLFENCEWLRLSSFQINRPKCSCNFIFFFFHFSPSSLRQ